MNSWGLVAVAAAGIGSAAIGAATGPDAPDAPDYAAANKAGIEADIATLARRRLIDSSAGLGRELLKEGYKRTFGGDVTALGAQAIKRVDDLRATQTQAEAKLTAARSNPAFTSGVGVAQAQAAIQAAQAEVDRVKAEVKAASASAEGIQKNGGEAIYQDAQGNVVARDAALEADFTGLGDADKAGANADKMAASMLELQRKYGSDFIAEARKQLEQSDPEGWAARKKLFADVMEDSERVEDRTLAKTLQQQMIEELNAGGSTDAATNREIEQFLTAQQTARGGGYGKADEYEQAMGVGQAGEARKAGRKQQALAFLTSGATPEDADYRQRQQSMGNLSNFMSGTTPTAQFGSLSGAQTGAAPYIPGAPGPTLNPNAGGQGAQYAQNNYNTQTNYASGQANPWLQGIGVGLQAYGISKMGGGTKTANPWGEQAVGYGTATGTPFGR